MASWEPALIEAVTRALGENPIEKIDHEAKVIEIKRDARVEPSVLQGRAAQLEEKKGGLSSGSDAQGCFPWPLCKCRKLKNCGTN